MTATELIKPRAPGRRAWGCTLPRLLPFLRGSRGSSKPALFTAFRNCQWGPAPPPRKEKEDYDELSTPPHLPGALTEDDPGNQVRNQMSV